MCLPLWAHRRTREVLAGPASRARASHIQGDGQRPRLRGPRLSVKNGVFPATVVSLSPVLFLAPCGLFSSFVVLILYHGIWETSLTPFMYKTALFYAFEAIFIVNTCVIYKTT